MSNSTKEQRKRTKNYKPRLWTTELALMGWEESLSSCSSPSEKWLGSNLLHKECILQLVEIRQEVTKLVDTS
jgi:hypothetical protein